MVKKYNMDSHLFTLQTSHINTSDFEKLVERLYVPLCFSANRFLNDKTAAEDIVQEAFTRLWMLHNQNKVIENIDNYMYMLVHNLSLEWMRTRKLQEKYLHNKSNKEVGFFNVIVETDAAMQIMEEIKKLPPQSRRVMEFVFQGMDNQEIAKEMNISINSVKTLKYKSIEKLRTIFSSDLILLILLAIK